jgi:hypothetical protein
MRGVTLPLPHTSSWHDAQLSTGTTLPLPLLGCELTVKVHIIQGETEYLNMSKKKGHSDSGPRMGFRAIIEGIKKEGRRNGEQDERGGNWRPVIARV